VLEKYCKHTEEVELSTVRYGSFCPITTVGKNIIRKSIESTKGISSDGLIRTRYMVLVKLPEPDGKGFQYECIDGNHRLAVFTEMGVKTWMCYVTPPDITQQEYHVLAFGKFYLFLYLTHVGLNNEHDENAVHSCEFEKVLLLAKLAKNFPGQKSNSIDWTKLMAFLGVSLLFLKKTRQRVLFSY